MNRIRIKHSENEIEVEGNDDFIKQQLESFYKKIEIAQTSIPPISLKKELLKKEDTKKDTGKIPSPAEFYRAKGKNDGISQLLIFGKYLELYKNQTEFTKSNINSLAKDTKLPKDIHSQYFTNAVKQGLLRSHAGGKYSLTLSAEEVIASM